MSCPGQLHVHKLLVHEKTCSLESVSHASAQEFFCLRKSARAVARSATAKKHTSARRDPNLAASRAPKREARSRERDSPVPPALYLRSAPHRRCNSHVRSKQQNKTDTQCPGVTTAHCVSVLFPFSRARKRGRRPTGGVRMYRPHVTFPDPTSLFPAPHHF